MPARRPRSESGDSEPRAFSHKMPRFTPTNAKSAIQGEEGSSPSQESDNDEEEMTGTRSDKDDSQSEPEDQRGRQRTRTASSQTQKTVFYMCPFSQDRPGYPRCTELEGGRKTKLAVGSLANIPLTR